MKKFNTQASSPFDIRKLFLVALVFVLTACSSIKLSYNHGETLLYWWLNAYVDLDSDQKGWVKEDIDKLFKWHRKTQLKDYVAVLQNGQKQLQGNVTAADLDADYRDVMKRAELLLTKATPQLAELALSLTPEQIAQMQKKFAANNADYRKKFLGGDKDKRLKVRYDKSMEQFELWFGSFSSEQKSAIRKASDARPLDNEIFLKERMRRQDNVLKLVQKVKRDKLNKEDTVILIQALVKDSFQRLDNSENKAFFDAYTSGTIQMVLGVIHSATPAQKVHVLKRMQGWIDDFNTLAAEPD